MPPAPYPRDDAERLRCLYSYGVLGTPPHPVFDRLIAEACRCLAMPLGLICLVDRQRLWVKARVGLALREVPREAAFCGYAILSDDLLIVSDAHADPRFCDNPLVLGEPYIRFYAGAPLRVGPRMRLGTLCVMDRTPRTLDAAGQRLLRASAQRVVSRLELDKVLREIAV